MSWSELELGYLLDELLCEAFQNSLLNKNAICAIILLASPCTHFVEYSIKI